MTSSVASRPGFLRWLVTAGDPATLVATFSTAAGSPVDLSGSTVAAACANWSTSHAGSATVGGASNNEVTVAFTDTITGQLTGGGWTWTLTVDGVTTLAGPLDVAQPGVAGVTGGDASAVVVVDDVNVAVTVVGGGGGGAVHSVNGQTGVVVLGAADVSADPAGTAAGLVDDLSGVTAPATARSNLGLGTAAVADTGTGAANVIVGSDARLTDARTPTAHTHSGADIVSATVATARLGSGTADATTFLRGDQTWAAVTPGASALNDLTDVDTATDPPAPDDVLAWDGVMWTPATLTALGAPGLSNATPADLGTAAAGVSTEASRADHVHDLPTAADVGAAASLHVHSGADITTGTVAAARLGSGTADATTFLRGDGTWTAPASSLPGWYTDLAYSPLMGTAHCQIGGGGAATSAFGADTLIMWRIMAVETVDIDGVTVMTQTAGGAGQQARFGIYSADVNGVPSGAAVVDSGAMSVSSAATLLTSTFTAVRLQPYRPMWAAMLTSSAAVTFRFLASAGANTTPGQMLDTGIFNTQTHQIRRATGVTFGALPTAPSMPFTNIDNIIPGVFWRTRRV